MNVQSLAYILDYFMSEGMRKIMKTTIYIFTLLLMVATIGCSDVGFEGLPKISCSDVGRDQNTDCISFDGTIRVSFTFGIGDVDILFVDDNSGSMSIEQSKMANAFPNFINNVANLFYRIAIITTDVSTSPGNATPRPANGMGKFQDGQFLEFTTEQKVPTGLYVVDNETPNVAGLFRGTIQRKETLDCDTNGYNPIYCPSPDERGIYAANLAIKRGDNRFFRSGAHLAVVILSDEDERSAGGQPGYPVLESDDLAESLVINTASLYPTKSLSVHSIITNDANCLSQQTHTLPNGNKLLGFIGYQYMKLSSPSSSMLSIGNLVPGHTGTICTNDFGSQMGDIGAAIQNRTFDAPKKLSCTPDAETIQIVTNPAGYEGQINYSIDSQDKVHFSNLPFGVKVTFSYDCPRF